MCVCAFLQTITNFTSQSASSCGHVSSRLISSHHYHHPVHVLGISHVLRANLCLDTFTFIHGQYRVCTGTSTRPTSSLWRMSNYIEKFENHSQRETWCDVSLEWFVSRFYRSSLVLFRPPSKERKRLPFHFGGIHTLSLSGEENFVSLVSLRGFGRKTWKEL